MKKYARGIDFFSDIICLFVMILYVFILAFGSGIEYLFIMFVILSCIFFPFLYYPFVFCLFRLRKCYYFFKDNRVIISMLIAKRRKNILDVYYYNLRRHKDWTMQPITYEFYYSDVIKIVCLGELKKSIRGLYSTDVYFILKDDKKAYLSRRQFSKKQVLEIINTIREKNKDVELGERLKRELKLT